MVDKLTKEIEKIVADREKDNKIREIQMKTEINMQVWNQQHKKLSLLDRFWRRLKK